MAELVEPRAAAAVMQVGSAGSGTRSRAHGRALRGAAGPADPHDRHRGRGPGRVWAAVTAVGLGSRVNTSIPRGLLALVSDEPPRYAVIDVGTNSVKFHVGELAADGTWRRVVDRADTTRLGDGLAGSGVISTAAVERTTAAIASMVEEAWQHHAQAIVAVGTAGLRAAGNRDKVIAAIEAATGVTVATISGEEESRLAYLAVRDHFPSADDALVVFDTGGGSSQFTFGRGTEVEDRFSVDVGAVRYTERFGLDGAVSTETLRAAIDPITADLDRLHGRPAPDALVGMGGAMTNITAVKLGLERYDPDAVQGATLTRDDIDRQIEVYRTRDVDARRTIVGLQPKRADVILAGACIVRTVMELLGQQTVTVSDRGLRHGLLGERFGPAARDEGATAETGTPMALVNWPRSTHGMGPRARQALVAVHLAAA